MADISEGIIFDIKELTVHDGPGVRVTVFFKGCPLRCRWCHNPEGLSPAPEWMDGRDGGKNVGERIQAADLAARLLQYEDVLAKTNGGITLSGGEPLMQPDFLLALLRALKPLHTAVQTSGHGDPAAFREMAALADLVLFDLKLTDAALHQEYTGKDNTVILQNLEQLKRTEKPFIARMPMIPGVNDNEAHYHAVAQLLADAKERVSVEILPYNPLSGAKYATVGRKFSPCCDENAARKYPVEALSQAGLSWRVL